MSNIIKILAALTILMFVKLPVAYAEDNSASDLIAEGQAIAFNRKKGNCLACHYIQGGTLMGTTGPALVAMKSRFPDKSKLLSQVSDARNNNEHTFMPPFGAHGILTKDEITLVVDWLYTL